MNDLKNTQQSQEAILKELNFSPNLTIKKREDYIDWDEYFLAVSILSAQRSKDPNTQVNYFTYETSKFFDHRNKYTSIHSFLRLALAL